MSKKRGPGAPEIQRAKEEIRSAFADVPAPPAWCLTESGEGEEPRLLAHELRHVPDWETLSAKDLARMPDGYGSALSFFSAEALRYYLPAYLLADLDGKDLGNVDVVFHLVHGFGREQGELVNERRYGARTWYDSASHRFSTFTRAQARAIVSFLRIRQSSAHFDEDRENIQRALDGYWIARAGAQS
jgi:hypothetical protein